MITVASMYTRVLEEADKFGSDYFALPDVLKQFKTQAEDFIGARAAEAERTQQVVDDIRTLILGKKITLNPNPDEAAEKIASVPNDYRTRLRVNVIYSDGSTGREPLVERHGESNSNTINPLRKASKDYPRIQQFANYFNVITNISLSAPIQPDKLLLVYVKKATYGSATTDACVDLPDEVIELLCLNTANALLVRTGDDRAQMDFQVTQTYRKK